MNINMNMNMNMILNIYFVLGQIYDLMSDKYITLLLMIL